MGQAWEGLRKRVPAWGSEGGGQDGIASDTEAEAWGGKKWAAGCKGWTGDKAGVSAHQPLLRAAGRPKLLPPENGHQIAADDQACPGVTQDPLPDPPTLPQCSGFPAPLIMASDFCF